MKPSNKYQALMQQPGYIVDPAQQQSIALLDDLYSRIVDAKPRGWLQRLVLRQVRYPRIKGVYFWGGVGRGKTMLMDLFYQALRNKTRVERSHFHGFMNEVHSALRQHQNTTNPLDQVAREIARRSQVICLDEFVIIDIGDAMIMAGLLRALFAEAVVLVTTSNAAPMQLYADGLQRDRFIPAIELIANHCQVVNLDGEQDYRLRFLQQTDLYSTPHTPSTVNVILDYLEHHVKPVQAEQSTLTVNGRELAHRYCAEDTVWFDFAELCETHRSQSDYLELARLFNTVIVTEIRQMSASDDDVARRFVLLIDVLYDHQVKLICSAAVAPAQLYLGKRLKFEFQRTASRLIEMQSVAYLGQAHSLQ